LIWRTAILAAVVALGACNGRVAHTGNWTAVQLEAFEQFRASRDGDRLELAQRVGKALPRVLQFATLEVNAPVEQLPEESEILRYLGPSDNTFTFDRHPEYMGGKVAAHVNLAEYRVHMYELGCYTPPADEVFCSVFQVVTFRGRVVMAFIVHDTPQSTRRWLSVH
jgi:hypothetical protein